MSNPYLCPPFVPLVSVFQPAERDGWKIDHWEMTTKNCKEQRDYYARYGMKPEIAGLEPATYVRLLAPDNKIVMSDTPMERRTCKPVVDHARGQVLVAGLGLGMVLLPILANPRVERVTVLELEPAVIALAEPQIRAAARRHAAKLTVQQADVWAYEPPGPVDAIWLDVWPETSPRNWPAMQQLARRYAAWLSPSGWLASWRQDDCRARFENPHLLREMVVAGMRQAYRRDEQKRLRGSNGRK